MVGNCERMARRIAEVAGADLFRIEVAKPYSKIYPVCAARARSEINKDKDVPLVGDVEGWEGYDIVLIGYPVWWYTIPQPVKRFIQAHDFSDKAVGTFNSYLGSGEGGTSAVVEKLAHPARMLPNVGIDGNTAKNDVSAVEAWVQRLGLQNAGSVQPALPTSRGRRT